MKRSTYFVEFIVFAVFAAATPAVGQTQWPDIPTREARRSAPSTIIAQDHASTAMESYLRGYADYLRAQYEGLVQEAEAALINAAVREKEMLNDDLHIRLKVAQKEARDNRRRLRTREAAVANIRRAAAKREAVLIGACELLSEASGGFFEWPKAFASPAYAEQVAQIESLLQRWTQDVAQASPSERRELAALVRDLRKGIQEENRGGAQHEDRVKAMPTVMQLELIASLDYAAPYDANLAMEVQ